MNKKKLIAFVLTLVVVFCSLCMPALAATGTVTSNEWLRLDDGDRLRVPSTAVDSNFIVVKYDDEASPGTLFGRVGYLIYEFSDITGLYEGAETQFTLYYTDTTISDGTALWSEKWSYDYYSDKCLITSLGENYRIVYSTFDYTTRAGTLLYPASYDPEPIVPPSVPDYNPETDKIMVTPSREYSGLIKAVNTVSDGTYKNWFVFRTPYVNSEVLNDDGVPVYDDIRWVYSLYFVSDDFQLSWGRWNDGSQACPHYVPYLNINASIIETYHYMPDGASSDAYTDEVLEASNGKGHWTHYDTSNESMSVGFRWFGGNPEIMANTDYLTQALRHMLVGSSSSVLIGETYDWSYYDEPYETSAHQCTSDRADVVDFMLPAVGWQPTFYDESDAPSVTVTDSDEVSWLKRIYYTIIQGFEAVIDKLSNLSIIGGGGVDPESPGLNDNIDDTVDSENPDSGFSLRDVIKNILRGILKVISGLFSLIADLFTDLVSNIGNFFDTLQDSTSELFDFFNNGHFGEADSFFGFMRDLWLCIPAAIRAFIYFSFGLTLFFVSLKMFHH